MFFSVIAIVKLIAIAVAALFIQKKVSNIQQRRKANQIAAAIVENHVVSAKVEDAKTIKEADDALDALDKLDH